MKKAIIILLALVIGIGILIGLYFYEDYKKDCTKNSNIIKMEVINVSTDTDGKFVDFEDGSGYYIETEDGNLWKIMRKVKTGDIVIFDTMGTESIMRDVKTYLNQRGVSL